MKIVHEAHKKATLDSCHTMSPTHHLERCGLER